MTLIVSPLTTTREPENDPLESKTALAAVSPAEEIPAAPMQQNAPVIVALPVIEKDAADDVALEPDDAAENDGVTRLETVLSTCGDGVA